MILIGGHKHICWLFFVVILAHAQRSKICLPFMHIIFVVHMCMTIFFNHINFVRLLTAINGTQSMC